MPRMGFGWPANWLAAFRFMPWGCGMRILLAARSSALNALSLTGMFEGLIFVLSLSFGLMSLQSEAADRMTRLVSILSICGSALGLALLTLSIAQAKLPNCNMCGL